MRGALLGAALIALAVFAPPASAETIKIGLVKVPASGPLFVAVERGYFKAEGLDPELVSFETGPPLAVGVASGDLDFGAAALIGAFYNLASQGQLRIIAAMSREMPGFQGQGYVVGKAAYDRGFTSLTSFGGRTVAVTALGGPAHYALGLLADKYRFDLASLHLVVTQSLTNAVAAVETGQADTTVISMTPAIPPLLRSGKVKLLGWVGDETPWQYGAVIAARGTTDDKPDLVRRFLRAFRHGTKDYHDAFVGPDGRRKDGPDAPAILAILAKSIGQPVEDVKISVTYADPDARLDVADVLHQIAWYQAHGLIKGKVDGASLIDRRYVQDLASR